VLLVGEEVNPEALQLSEHVDKRAGRAGKAIVAIVALDQHNVYFVFAHGIEHTPGVGTVFVAAGRVVDALTGDGKAARRGIRSKLAQLGFRVLLAPHRWRRGRRSQRGSGSWCGT
jgi:hypothetical protein